MDNSSNDQTQKRKAVIDVGSNSVKLLIADVDAEVVTTLLHEGRQTRLGRDVFETGYLKSEAISDTVRAVVAFVEKANKEGVAAVRVFATSAAREANNGNELVAALAKAGLELEIIEGAKEAELILSGVRSLSQYATGLLSVIDVGGGSTELLVADDVTLHLQHSFALGTVRWLERFGVSDLPSPEERTKLSQALDDFLDEEVTPRLGASPLPTTLIGAGGTPVFLSRILEQSDSLSSDEIESLRWSLSDVQELNNRLWNMSLAERYELPGLPANRADVIIIGTAIYEALMIRCGFRELRPTLRGVRYGALFK